jgi:hypothetical protein
MKFAEDVKGEVRRIPLAVSPVTNWRWREDALNNTRRTIRGPGSLRTVPGWGLTLAPSRGARTEPEDDPESRPGRSIASRRPAPA